MKTYKQLKNEHFVFVDNNFFTKEYQDNFSCESILLLSLIQKNLTVRNKCIFNLKYLYDVLGVKSNNSTQKKKIKNCLIQLQKNNIITSNTNIAKANNNQLIFVSIKIPDKNYTIVYDFELDAIINYKQENLYNLFNLFAFLKYKIGIKKYCYWNQENIAYSIGLKSRKVVSRMINILSTELKLIKVDNVGNRIFKDGSVKQSNNMYVLNYENADKLLEEKKARYKQELEQNGVKITKCANANQKRSIKQKLNLLWQKYDNKTIADDELDKLKNLEQQYYKLYKNRPSKLCEIEFRVIDIDEEDLETKKYINVDNNLVDSKTGELVEQEDLENINDYIIENVI